MLNYMTLHSFFTVIKYPPPTPFDFGFEDREYWNCSFRTQDSVEIEAGLEDDDALVEADQLLANLDLLSSDWLIEDDYALVEADQLLANLDLLSSDW